MYANPFVLPTSEYQRDINILKHYADDQAAHLALVTKRPLAECQAFVRKAVSPGGQFALKDPRVVCLHRGENGDREQIETTLSKYIGEAIKDRDLIAPTFTTYLHPTVKKSVLVDFIDANVKARSVAKKEMFAAELAGDLSVKAFKKTEQTNRKLSNKRIFPAVDVNLSSTRREDLLLDQESLNRIWILRNFLSDMNSVEAMGFLVDRMNKTNSNEEFLISMNDR